MNSKEDNSYNEMKGRSAIQWLTETMNSENKIDKSGAKVTLEHIEYLNRRIKVYGELTSWCHWYPWVALSFNME